MSVAGVALYVVFLLLLATVWLAVSAVFDSVLVGAGAGRREPMTHRVARVVRAVLRRG